MSTNNTTLTCPARAVPEPVGLNIDSKSVFVVVPRGNYTDNTPDDWMVTCCEPNPVQLATDGERGNCWEWCDLPSQYTNGTSSSSQQSSSFMRCLTSNARATNSSFPPTAVLLSAAARGGVVGDGMIGLAAVLVVAFWRLLM